MNLPHGQRAAEITAELGIHVVRHYKLEEGLAPVRRGGHGIHGES